ncbi:MAG: dihydrodipicolinate synthase family protein [Chitinophagaceae bacterium]
MNIEKKYTGIIVPAVTPLTSEYKLDKEAVEKIFSNFYQHTISPFILGTTGESASLSIELKQKYAKRAGKIKQSNTMLYAGISSNSFIESVDFAKYCFDHGADVVVATLPSYYPLTEDQMKKYFIDLADAIAAPLVIYNIPATTHMSIPISLVDELSHHPHIVGTKDSERNEERLQQSLSLWKERKDFSHFLGWAPRSVAALFSGTDGLVPSTGNLVPEIYSAILQAVKENNRNKAYEMQELSDTYGKLYQDGRTLGQSLWALKLLMQQKGLCQPHVMPPLQPQSQEEADKLMKAMNGFKV